MGFFTGFKGWGSPSKSSQRSYHERGAISRLEAAGDDVVAPKGTGFWDTHGRLSIRCVVGGVLSSAAGVGLLLLSPPTSGPRSVLPSLVIAVFALSALTCAAVPLALYHRHRRLQRIIVEVGESAPPPDEDRGSTSRSQ